MIGIFKGVFVKPKRVAGCGVRGASCGFRTGEFRILTICLSAQIVIKRNMVSSIVV